MKAKRIFETVLYAEDLAAAETFYSDILHLRLVEKTDHMLAYRLETGMLLIFDPIASREGGRSVPAHGMKGMGHIAFAASGDELLSWERHFEMSDVPIEKVHEWEAGGRSIYVRDPAGNSVEFAPSTLWGGDWAF